MSMYIENGLKKQFYCVTFRKKYFELNLPRRERKERL